VSRVIIIFLFSVIGCAPQYSYDGKLYNNPSDGYLAQQRDLTSIIRSISPRKKFIANAVQVVSPSRNFVRHNLIVVTGRPSKTIMDYAIQTEFKRRSILKRAIEKRRVFSSVATKFYDDKSSPKSSEHSYVVWLRVVSPTIVEWQLFLPGKNDPIALPIDEEVSAGLPRVKLWIDNFEKIIEESEQRIAQEKGGIVTPKVADDNNSSVAPHAPRSPKSRPSPPSKSSTSGSGFFVSKLGHIVTNQHVVKECTKLTVGDNANSQVQATVIESDRRNDLALLKISSTEMASDETKSLIRKLGSPLSRNLGLKVVPLSSNGLLRSDDVELGESLLVAGYPYGDIFSNTIKVTKGIVSAIRGIGDDSGQFQLDAAVQPGNSGGPIYDENGNIVGVVVAQLNKLKMAKTIGSLPENVNFGIKASTVRSFLTSSGLPTKWSARSKSMSTKELAKIARNQTVMVVCHR
jgi:S1-C subfamily serine protease